MTSLWDLIKTNYRSNFGIPKSVIDFVSVRPILIKSLSGYSNRRIAVSMSEEETYIRGVLKEFLKFSGWNQDLDFNPIALYNINKGNLNWYRHSILSTSRAGIRFIDKTFYLVRNFYNNIESEIKKYYESS